MSHIYQYSAILLLSLCISVTGCKRDATIQTAAGTSRVKTETTTSGTGIAYAVSYSYDSSGRQIQAQTDTVITTYTYGRDTITKVISLAGERFITGYTTNSLGKIISDSKFYKYAYDGNGYLISFSYTGGSDYDSTAYIISSGDVSSSTEHQSDSSTDNHITTTYTYLTTADPRDYGTAAWGQADKHLLSAKTITQLINGNTYTTSYTYSYAYDSQGRVSQQIQTNGSASYITSYTYY